MTNTGLGTDRERIHLAACSLKSGDWARARRYCADILQENPRNPDALHLLGVVSCFEGDSRGAEHNLKEAVLLSPENAAWWCDLALARFVAKNWQAGLEAISRSLEIDPTDGTALRAHAQGLTESDRLDDAGAAFERWGRVQPEEPAAWLGAARCNLRLKRPGRAAELGRLALSAGGDPLPAHELLAQAYLANLEPDRAMEHCLEVARLLPGEPTAAAFLAIAYCQIGDSDSALSLFRGAVPQSLPPRMHAAFLSALLHHADSKAEDLLEAHKVWAKQHRPEPLTEPPLERRAHRSRKLAIGYLCTEPRSSPIFSFFPPLLRSHDRNQFDVRLYCREPRLLGKEDEAGVRHSELLDVSGWSERKIAGQMRRDGIDISIDLSGHFGDCGLLVAAMRGAPIQVSYPSYPCTTGIPEIDYIFTDRWTCAPGQESQYLERPYFLNSGYLVYAPPEGTGPVEDLPSQRNGCVTFGCFQRPAKLNRRVWDAVAEIMRRVKNSRLLLHYPSVELDQESSRTRQRLTAALESRGIGCERVQFRGMMSRLEHMHLVSTVDVALDSFPYSGQTTTCECLWMGAPVVTLAGSTHASRVSAGLLLRMGLGRFVAKDLGEYVALAEQAAKDASSLGELRRGLRDHFRASTVFDAERLAAEVEKAFTRMWRS
jgi:protein O-GlcNAc transferase